MWMQSKRRGPLAAYVQHVHWWYELAVLQSQRLVLELACRTRVALSRLQAHGVARAHRDELVAVASCNSHCSSLGSVCGKSLEGTRDCMCTGAVGGVLFYTCSSLAVD